MENHRRILHEDMLRFSFLNNFSSNNIQAELERGETKSKKIDQQVFTKVRNTSGKKAKDGGQDDITVFDLNWKSKVTRLSLDCREAFGMERKI